MDRRIWASKDWYSESYGIHIIEFDLSKPSGRKQSRLSNLVFEEYSEGSYVGDSPLRLSVTEAQALMDTLWDCGVRPASGGGSAGSFEAQRKHLDDMRSIAFHKLGIK